jgi:hypothetical protein
VQPFEILLHHDVIGDNSRCIDTLRFRRSHFFQSAVCALWSGRNNLAQYSVLVRKRVRYCSVPVQRLTHCSGRLPQSARDQETRTRVRVKIWSATHQFCFAARKPRVDEADS